MIQPIWAWRKCAPWACPPKLRLRQRHRMKFHPPVGQGTPAYDPVYLLGSPCGLARLGVWHVDVRLLHGALDQPRACVQGASGTPYADHQGGQVVYWPAQARMQSGNCPTCHVYWGPRDPPTTKPPPASWPFGLIPKGPPRGMRVQVEEF